MHEPELISIRPVSVAAIRPLRHAVLRAGFPLEAAVFDGDNEPTAHHIAAFDPSGEIVGCATIVRRPWNAEPAWQLRGMAIDARWRGQGVGRRLLEKLEAIVRDEPFSVVLWCNGRTPAVGFYAAMGWTAVGEEFEIEASGPHYRMVKRLG